MKHLSCPISGVLPKDETSGQLQASTHFVMQNGKQTRAVARLLAWMRQNLQLPEARAARGSGDMPSPFEMCYLQHLSQGHSYVTIHLITTFEEHLSLGPTNCPHKNVISH